MWVNSVGIDFLAFVILRLYFRVVVRLCGFGVFIVRFVLGLAGFWFSVLLLVVFVFCLLIGLVFGLVGLAVGLWFGWFLPVGVSVYGICWLGVWCLSLSICWC